MANEQAEIVTKAKSLEEIADIMAANTMARLKATDTQAEDKVLPNEVAEDEEAGTDDKDKDDDQHIDTGDSGDELDLDILEKDDEGTVDEDILVDDEQRSVSDEDDEFVIDDNDLVELSEGVTATLGDLKKVYQSEDTIKASIEAQEVSTNEALRERAKAMEDGQKASIAMAAVFKHIDQVVAQPFVGPPDDAMKETNPAGYIQHLEAYNQDQRRIQETRQTLTKAVEAHTNQQKELHAERQRHELGLLTEKIPALRKQETRKQATQDIQDAATYYGFDQSELSAVADHRLLNMAYEAQQYRKLMSKSGKSVEDLTEVIKKQGAKQTRTLRSKGTSAKNRVTASAKKRKVLVSKAKKSGKVSDVAALIASKHST